MISFIFRFAYSKVHHDVEVCNSYQANERHDT